MSTMDSSLTPSRRRLVHLVEDILEGATLDAAIAARDARRIAERLSDTPDVDAELQAGIAALARVLVEENPRIAEKCHRAAEDAAIAATGIEAAPW